MIHGSYETLTFPCFAPGPLQIFQADAGDISGIPIETFTEPEPEHIQQPLIQVIVDELQGEGECPSTGTTALRTNAVIDRVLTDYYGGREDAFWERPDSWPGS